MDKPEVFEKILESFDGSPSKLAAALNENSVAAVCNWRERGVPANKAMQIQVLTGISVKVLRPDDWADYWPDPTPKRPRRAKSAEVA